MFLSIRFSEIRINSTINSSDTFYSKSISYKVFTGFTHCYNTISMEQTPFSDGVVIESTHTRDEFSTRHDKTTSMFDMNPRNPIKSSKKTSK